jgi:hypothetical protein
MKAINNFNYSGEALSFEESFKNIILEKLQDYDSPKNFFEDLQNGGCLSGLISEFIYNSDCKDFYIEHIDDLEWMKEDLEDNLGEPIKNRHKLPHYVFMCHLCFEEYAYKMYDEIYEILKISL